MAEKEGFDLGSIGDVVGGLIGGKGVDIAKLEPIWESVQPTLKGLDTDSILDNVAKWAEELDLPLVKDIPDSVIENLKNGVKVPLNKLIKG
jgi:hypothetical protein